MTARVVLAGVGTPDVSQHHQRDMYVPAVQEIDGATVIAVLARSEQERASALARDLNVPLSVPDAIPPEADLVIACPDTNRPEDLVALLSGCADAQVPVLLDKPTLFEPALLTDLAARFPQVASGHHPRFHPALSTARARVTSGDLGLLHAVHGELLVGRGDGPHPRGELSNLAVYALDVVRSLGCSLRGRGHAVCHAAGPDESGEAWTISMRCAPDVAVTMLVGRAGAREHRTHHRYRILGSHGQLLVDLDSPALDVLGAQPERLTFGPTSVASLVSAVLAGQAGSTLDDAAELARIITALDTSAAEHRTVDL